VAKRRKRRKLCPQGVAKDCRYCVELKGKVWHVLDPKGVTIDEASDQREAMGIADGYVSQCFAARSGYGGRGEFKTDGKFKWTKLAGPRSAA